MCDILRDFVRQSVSLWLLEIKHGRKIYTMEFGKYYKSGLWTSPSLHRLPGNHLLKTYQHIWGGGDPVGHRGTHECQSQV